MVTEKEVWDALKKAIDFELGVDVVNLGLIYEVRVDNGKDVYIKMTLTTPTCPLANAIIADVYQKVKAIEGVGNVDIEVTFDPPWNPDMMSPQARKLLGM